MKLHRRAAACLMLYAGLAAPGLAMADPVSDFYRGKSVELIVGFSPGGGYDVYARLVGRHMGKQIPGNPTIVVKNMEGAGSTRRKMAPFSAALRGAFLWIRCSAIRVPSSRTPPPSVTSAAPMMKCRSAERRRPRASAPSLIF